jgi:hypothetical protein
MRVPMIYLIPSRAAISSDLATTLDVLKTRYWRGVTAIAWLWQSNTRSELSLFHLLVQEHWVSPFNSPLALPSTK